MCEPHVWRESLIFRQQSQIAEPFNFVVILRLLPLHGSLLQTARTILRLTCTTPPLPGSYSHGRKLNKYFRFPAVEQILHCVRFAPTLQIWQRDLAEIIDDTFPYWPYTYMNDKPNYQAIFPPLSCICHSNTQRYNSTLNWCIVHWTLYPLGESYLMANNLHLALNQAASFFKEVYPP